MVWEPCPVAHRNAVNGRVSKGVLGIYKFSLRRPFTRPLPSLHTSLGIYVLDIPLFLPIPSHPIRTSHTSLRDDDVQSPDLVLSHAPHSNPSASLPNSLSPSVRGL